MMNEARYLQFQKLLTTHKLFRYFWQFWSNYAFIFFAIAGLIVITTTDLTTVQKPLLVLSIVSFIVARVLIVTAINIFYKRRRPYQRFNFVPIVSKFFSLATDRPNSFPSRHTTAYFSVAVIVLLFIPALGSALIIVSLLAGSARVILGYHWPSDILGGAIVGTVVAVLTVFALY